MYRVRPSRPAAVLSAVVGAVICVVGLTTTHASHPGFLVVWVLVLVAVVGFNLWAAFSPHGATETITRDDEPGRPHS